MKACIVGAGAIGGYIGARLALRGEAHVCALSRGATLVALQRDGWRLQIGATRCRPRLAPATMPRAWARRTLS
jgi:Ketopantoate reductase